RQSFAAHLRRFFTARSSAASVAASRRRPRSRRGAVGGVAALRARSVSVRGALAELPVSRAARCRKKVFVVGGATGAICRSAGGDAVRAGQRGLRRLFGVQFLPFFDT